MSTLRPEADFRSPKPMMKRNYEDTREDPPEEKEEGGGGAGILFIGGDRLLLRGVLALRPEEEEGVPSPTLFKNIC